MEDKDLTYTDLAQYMKTGGLGSYANYIDTKGNSNLSSIYDSLQELIKELDKDAPNKKQTKPNEGELELFTLKNAEKLNGKFHKGGHEYEITYIGRGLELSADNYTWKIKNVIGGTGKLSIERRIGYNENNEKVVWFKWSGNETQEEPIQMTKLKDPLFIKEYLVRGIDGEYNEFPF